jgi:transposase
LITLRGDFKALIATRPVDFRRGIHGLTSLVAEALHADPYCGNVFVFRSKRADRIKMVVWDGSGMILLTKWLEKGRFVFPPIRDGALSLSEAELAVLFSGLDWTRVGSKVVDRPSKLA